MTDFENSEDDVRDLAARFKLVYLTIGMAFLIFLTRLWFLQIMQGDELREFSEKNRVKETKIPAPRGRIFDRDGRILVDNQTGFDATITPQYASHLEETAKEVGQVLGIEPQKIIEDVKTSRRKNGPFFAVTIKENMTLDDVFRIKRLRIDHPGLNVRETILRYYPLEDAGAQLFGYVGEVSKSEIKIYSEKYAGKVQIDQGAVVGKGGGIEDVYDLDLRGRDGLSFIEVDAHGRSSQASKEDYFELKPQRAEPGHDFVLTIDRDIQLAAHTAMLTQKDLTGPRIGGIVVMKTNGEVLAWVNTPAYNPNKFARGISTALWKELTNDPFKPLRNKVIQDHFMPGSTIKPIVAVSALQEGKITANTIVYAPGQMRYGNRIYHDSLRQGHGNITVIQAIEQSSNIFFYKMGIELGIDNIAKYASLMGLGQKTGIELKNEAIGLFPTKEWKQRVKNELWQPGENLSNAIGQGFVLTNVLQMALAYNSIATDGKVVRPFILQKMVNEKGEVVKEIKPVVVRDLIAGENGVKVDPKHLKTVREAMKRVANGEGGTARWWKIPGIPFAGKTGTSQVRSFSADEIYDRCEKRPIMDRHHGTFIGYAPADNPEIVVAALTEHACHGNTGAVPVVRDVMLAYFQKYHPEMIKSKTPVKPVAPVIPEQPEELAE